MYNVAYDRIMSEFESWFKCQNWFNWIRIWIMLKCQNLNRYGDTCLNVRIWIMILWSADHDWPQSWSDDQLEQLKLSICIVNFTQQRYVMYSVLHIGCYFQTFSWGEPVLAFFTCTEVDCSESTVFGGIFLQSLWQLRLLRIEFY